MLQVQSEASRVEASNDDTGTGSFRPMSSATDRTRGHPVALPRRSSLSSFLLVVPFGTCTMRGTLLVFDTNVEN